MFYKIIPYLNDFNDTLMLRLILFNYYLGTQYNNIDDSDQVIFSSLPKKRNYTAFASKILLDAFLVD